MNDLAQPIVILSDLHINQWSPWREKLEALRGLWQGAGSVVFNGDTMNLDVASNDAMREEIIACIDELCRQDGVRPIIIGGNSDHQLPGARHVTLADEKVLVLHGDAVFPESSPWRANAGEYLQVRARIGETLPPQQRDTLEGRLDIALHVLREMEPKDSFCRCSPSWLVRLLGKVRLLFRPRCILTVLRFWRRAPRMAAEFLAKYAPRTQCIVIGHVHRPGMWRIDGKTVVNTGSFESPAKPRMVELDGGELRLRKIIKTKQGYKPGRVVDRHRLSCQ